MKRSGKIAIVAVGLIGGSIGLAIRSRRLAGEVVGIGHRHRSIKKALGLGVIDRGTLDIGKGVQEADIVIMATPVLKIVPLVKRAAPHLKQGCIVTDVGSTKGRLTRDITAILPGGVDFVGGHPMAGSEKRGVEQADRRLFRDSLCILTRTGKTDKAAFNMIKNLWSAIGARVVAMSPGDHDRIVSQISHLPHMLIFSMLANIDKKSLRYASTGFYDTTRIASSDPAIWKDITVTNSSEISRSLARSLKGLRSLKEAVDRRDSRALLRIFRAARKNRDMSLRGR
jgi:prephenate dehydrogenase